MGILYDSSLSVCVILYDSSPILFGLTGCVGICVPLPNFLLLKACALALHTCTAPSPFNPSLSGIGPVFRFSGGGGGGPVTNEGVGDERPSDQHTYCVPRRLGCIDPSCG